MKEVKSDQLEAARKQVGGAATISNLGSLF
jgi:hypothetical protein